MRGALLSAVRALAPDLTPGARQAVGRCLAPLSRSAWPDLAWRFSRLTEDGFPVEFAFSSRDDALRVTLEAAGPERAEGRRLAAAVRLASEIEPFDADAVLAQLSAPAPRWGAWLGLRQAGPGLRAKIYVETTRPPPNLTHWGLPGAVKMLGYEPAGGRLETYIALPPMDRIQLTSVLAAAGAPPSDAMAETLVRCWGAPLDAGLAWAGLGLSLASRDGERLAGASLFFRARAALGGQGAIRKALLGQSATGACAYRRLWGQASDQGLPDHGVVSLVQRPDGEVELRCGLSGRAVLAALGHVSA
jgi:hypothetical protein